MKNVLIVEDELSLSDALKLKLESLPINLLCVQNTNAARQALAENAVDLILLDIVMPGEENGLDLLRSIKSDTNLKSIPVLVITNLDNKKDESLTSGALEYIVKSDITIEDLIEKVRNYVSL